MLSSEEHRLVAYRGSAKPEHDFENARFIMLLGRNPAAGLQLRQLKDMASDVIAGLASWSWILAQRIGSNGSPVDTN